MMHGRYTTSRRILTFPSHMVHKGLRNQMPDRIRISLDLRYQSATEPIDESSLTPHMGVATWDEIYAGWKNEKLKYYWASHDLKISPWDPSLLKASDRIC